MCKIVYLTSRRHDKPAKVFRETLAAELRKRGVEVVSKSTCPFSCIAREHKTYGMAIGIDFFRDRGEGRGLTLNERTSNIGRDFAYNLSNAIDIIVPRIRWRDFSYVKSDNSTWYKFFNKTSAETKAIFYLCTYTDEAERNIYNITFDKVIKAFSDEIVRCLRSNYDRKNYQQRVKAAQLRTSKTYER